MSPDADTVLLHAAVARGLLTSDEARAWLEAARRAGRPAARLLVERGRLDGAVVQALEATVPPGALGASPAEAAPPPLDATLPPPPVERPVAAPPGDMTWWDRSGATRPAPAGGPSDPSASDDVPALAAPIVAPTVSVIAPTVAVPPPGQRPFVFGGGPPGVSTGTVLGGDWEVLEPLGAGGMGAVYRGRQRSLGREVALKVLPPHTADQGEAAERFLREARSAAAVRHPNVITVFAGGRDEVTGQLFIAMELVRGGDAAALMQRSGGRLPERRALEIARDVARGLTALEAAGLVHRDIKPANMFLAEDGTAKLADLGLARGLADRMTETGAVVGTPAYMSPEQAQGAQGELDIGTDIYAVGASLYTLLTGRPPFEGETVLALLRQVLDAPAPDPRSLVPSVSARTAAVIARAMAKPRASRHATAAELVDDLERALASLDGADTPARRPAPLVVSGALCAVGAVGVALALTVAPTAPAGPAPVAAATEPTRPPEAAATAPAPPPASTPTEAGTEAVGVASVDSTVLTWTTRGDDTDGIAIAGGTNWRPNERGFLVLRRAGESAITVRFDIEGSPRWVHLRMGHLGAVGSGGAADAWIDIDVNGRPLLVGEQPRRPQFFDITTFVTPGPNELTVRLLARSTTAYWLEWVQVHHGAGATPPFLGAGRVDR